MKKLTKILSIALSLTMVFWTAACNSAQKVATSTPKAVSSGLPDAASDKALLWEITGKGLAKPSFLFGTIHIIPRTDFFLSNSARKAIDMSEKVVFEIDMKEMMNPFKILGLLGKMRMNGGKKICDYLTTDECNELKVAMKEKGLDFDQFSRMKPMFISSMFETGDEKGNMMSPDGKTTSYEMEIMRLAAAAKPKKKTGGLETVEFQMSMFDSIPYEEQCKMLIKAIREGSSGNSEMFGELVKIYKSQDIEAMANMMDSDKGETELANYETLLITKRNQNWIPLMGDQMLEKPTFFAVGAGHLGGALGVVNLLRQAGYTVRPLK